MCFVCSGDENGNSYEHRMAKSCMTMVAVCLPHNSSPWFFHLSSDDDVCVTVVIICRLLPAVCSRSRPVTSSGKHFSFAPIQCALLVASYTARSICANRSFLLATITSSCLFVDCQLSSWRMYWFCHSSKSVDAFLLWLLSFCRKDLTKRATFLPQDLMVTL